MKSVYAGALVGFVQGIIVFVLNELSNAVWSQYNGSMSIPIAICAFSASTAAAFLAIRFIQFPQDATWKARRQVGQLCLLTTFMTGTLFLLLMIIESSWSPAFRGFGHASVELIPAAFNILLIILVIGAVFSGLPTLIAAALSRRVHGGQLGSLDRLARQQLCSNCGTPNPIKHNFCAACGDRLERDQTRLY